MKQIASKWSPWWFYRPKEAENCSLLNTGGKAGGEVGFPSSHAAITGFVFLIVFVYLYIKYPHYGLKIFLTLLVFALFALFSRLMKDCDNILQTFIGFIIGLLCAYVFVKQWMVAYLGYQFTFQMPNFDTTGLTYSLNHTKLL